VKKILPPKGGQEALGQGVAETPLLIHFGAEVSFR